MGRAASPGPAYRRPRTALDDDAVARLVRMREDGATWKEIGRAFKKQEGACKSIFDKARTAAAGPPPAAPPA